MYIIFTGTIEIIINGITIPKLFIKGDLIGRDSLDNGKARYI